MANMVPNQKLLLVKQQSTFGTPETSGLDGDHAIETEGPHSLSYDADVTEVRRVAGVFDQDLHIPGAKTYEVSFSTYCHGGGSADSGDYGRLLQVSGLAESETTGTFTYTPINDLTALKDATIWTYSGNTGSSSSVLRKMGNVILSPKWTFEANKPAMLELTGTGVKAAAVADSTQPSVTKERVDPSAMINASTITINGDSDYGIISGEIDFGQEVSMKKDPKDTYGRGASTVTDRQIRWSFQVYADTVATINPEAALEAKTTGTLQIAFGSAPSSVDWTLSYSQILGIEHNEDDGFETYTISGLAARNDFTHTLVTS